MGIIQLYRRVKNSNLSKLIYKTKSHNLVYKVLCLRPIDYFGFKLYCNPNDHTITPLILQGVPYEQDSINFIGSKIKKGDTVVDIGANIGLYTLFLSRLVGENGKIYAFEPDLKAYRYLIKNLKINKINNTIPINKGLGNKNETTYLYVDAVTGGANSLSPKNLEKIKDKILVNITTLDHFFDKEVNNLKIDFIKSDAQGAEPLIFEGAKNILEENKNLKILMEFWPFGIRNLGKDPTDFLEYMRSFDFNIYMIENNKALEVIDFIKFTDSIENKSYNSHENWTNLYLEKRYII